jgi:hypothetical protein
MNFTVRIDEPKILRMNKPPKLLDQVRERIRAKHYSIRTEEAYVDWAKRFILFHNKRHPKEMGAAEVEAFLSYLAVERHVSASTQNQAKAALLFLYKEVLNVDLPWLKETATISALSRNIVSALPRAVSIRCSSPRSSD